MAKSKINSTTGLTEVEQEVMDALVKASNLYSLLQVQHDSEPKDFVDAIHRCQDLLAVRIARRKYPIGWPTHNTKDNIVAVQAIRIEGAK